MTLKQIRTGVNVAFTYGRPGKNGAFRAGPVLEIKTVKRGPRKGLQNIVVNDFVAGGEPRSFRTENIADLAIF